jgi:hypothetical protein
MIVNDRWVRLAVLGFVGILVTFIVGLMPIITSTPEGIQPRVKIKLLDLLQSKALARTARAQTAAYEWESSFFSWRLAIANDAGNVGLSREYMEALSKAPMNNENRFWIDTIYPSMAWLLKLSENNEEDILLCAKLLDRYSMLEEAKFIIRYSKKQNHPDFLAYKIKSHYLKDDFDRFQKDWSNLFKSPVSTKLENSAQPPTGLDKDLFDEVKLYQLAWLASSKQDAGSYQALIEASKTEELVSEVYRPESKFIDSANRLLCWTAALLGDTEHFEMALNRLTETGNVSPVEHSYEWILIAKSDEAAALKKAEEFLASQKISDFTTAMKLNRALTLLKFEKLQSTFLDNCLRTFSRFNPRIWIISADHMIEYKKWPQLKSLASELELDPIMGAKLRGLALFYKGLADFQRGSQSTTPELFKDASETPFPNVETACYVASGMSSLGFTEIARACLLNQPDEMAQGQTYNALLFELAIKLKNENQALEAARALYEINPAHPVYQNNLAAALISSETDPDLAIQLSEQTRETMPKVPAFAINSAMAYLTKENGAQARALLEPFMETPKSALEEVFWNYCWARILEIEGDVEAAKARAQGIDIESLFQTQRDRLAALTR